MGGERDGEGWGGKGREERRAGEEGEVERRGGDAVLRCVRCSIRQLSSPADPTLQGPCGRSPKRRGSLRFLPPLEVRPSSVAPERSHQLHSHSHFSEAPWEVP